jgi:hypothetical protein
MDDHSKPILKNRKPLGTQAKSGLSRGNLLASQLDLTGIIQFSSKSFLVATRLLK